MDLKDWHFKKLCMFLSQGAIEPLPQGYKRVEYLESTGTQYINTGYYIKIDTGLEIDYSLTSTGLNASQYIMGARRGTGNIYGFSGSVSNTATVGIWQPASTTLLNVRNTIRHTLKNLVSGVAIDDEVKAVHDRTTPQYNDIPVFIFAFNSSNTHKGMRCYGAKIYSNNTVVMNFIPCLDNNNRPCMYDTVTKQTFYNQGTGKFLYGNVV